MSQQPTPSISVIVPTYNRARVLQDCLKALDEQTLAASDMEVIVADDGSTDDTPKLLGEITTNYQLRSIRQQNEGPATARNRAIELARAPLLLMLNDDAILDVGTVAGHLDHYRQTLNAHRAMVGPCRIHEPAGAKDVAPTLDRFHLLLPQNHHDVVTPCKFTDFVTANLSVSKQAVDEIGGYDTEFPYPAGEDIDLGYKLTRRGLQLHFDPGLGSEHRHSFSYESYANMVSMRAQASVMLLAKHEEFVRVFPMWVIFVAKINKLIRELGVSKMRLRLAANCATALSEIDALPSDATLQMLKTPLNNLYKYAFLRGFCESSCLVIAHRQIEQLYHREPAAIAV